MFIQYSNQQLGKKNLDNELCQRFKSLNCGYSQITFILAIYLRFPFQNIDIN